MKSGISVLAALAAASLLAFSCDSGMEEYNPSDYPDKPSSGKPSTPVVTVGWAALADSLEIVLTENFMDRSKGTFWGTPFDRANSSAYLYWQQAHAMDVLVHAYERIRGSEPERAEKYASWMRLWFENDANNYNNSHEADGPYGHFYNDWIDDMAWICLTMLHISEALGDDLYADTAMQVYDNYIIPMRKENGGLPWTRLTGPDMEGQNACTNSPSCLVAAKLYRKYRKPSYLEDAKGLFNFVKNNLLASDFRVEDPPLSYTQGTFAEACRQLFIITGDSSYMTLAGDVLYYAFTSNRCTSGGLLRHEGTNDDQALFKGILIPYTVNYILDERCTFHSEDLRALLMKNAKALEAHLDRSRFPQMYAGYYWGENFDYSGTGSMCAHVSGTHLMEGVARLTGE